MQQKKRKAKARAAPVSSQGQVRIYADISKQAAIELKVLAARRGVPAKGLLELLIYEATRQQKG